MKMARSVSAEGLSREYLTITVTGLRRLKFRHWIAAKIFIFGAWVAATGIDIDMPPDQDEQDSNIGFGEKPTTPRPGAV